jgi:hypothetical protein
MKTEIATLLGGCLSIVFRNTARGNELVVWVCVDRAAYDKALAGLSKLSHCVVVHSGLAHVEGTL